MFQDQRQDAFGSQLCPDVYPGAPAVAVDVDRTTMGSGRQAARARRDLEARTLAGELGRLDPKPGGCALSGALQGTQTQVGDVQPQLSRPPHGLGTKVQDGG